VPGGFLAMEDYLPFNLVAEIKESKFFELSHISKEEFEESLSIKLQNFKCDLIDFKF
jgi:hypothetical protein